MKIPKILFAAFTIVLITFMMAIWMPKYETTLLKVCITEVAVLGIILMYKETR